MSDSRENLNLIFYLGTHRLAACLAEIEPNRARILRISETIHPPGFQKGGVAELDKALASIESLVKELELGQSASEIPASVILSTPTLKTTRFSSSVYYSGYPRVITSREVRQIIEQTRNVAPLPLQDWILQAVPESFWVNDLTGVKDPTGLEAQRLAVTLQIFSVDYSFFRNLSRVFETLEFNLKGYFPKTYFLAEGVLTAEEKERNAFILDFCDEATHLVLTQEGKILQSKSLPWGSRFLTAKIAERWKVDSAEAQRLKEQFGSLEDLKSGAELIPLVDGSKHGNHQIRRTEFHAAFQSFAEELFSKIEAEVSSLVRQTEIREPHFVLTGGGAQLDGLVDFLSRRLNHSVRLGTPRQIEMPSSLLPDPGWAAIVGFILSAEQQIPESDSARESAFSRLLTQAKEFLAAYF